MSIDADFRALTGFAPLSWQARLYREHLARGRLPLALDVPTGLGKTSVMALWLIARARGAALPRRLVYVVDRRAVVDQATEEAEKLREALEGEAAHLKEALRLGRPLPISTLRGAYVDNREWLDDPVAPAIVVGTVDMIGSRLLFEGYGVSSKMRPYQAGLLGVDALIVLDEAHLVPPFTHLLRAIERDASLWPQAEVDRRLVPRLAVLPLSATQRNSGKDAQECSPFRLDDSDRKDKTVAERLDARKRLRLETLAEADPDKQLAKHAWELATRPGKPARVVVFCDRREKKDDGGGPSVQGVADAIEALAKGEKAKGDKKAARPKTDRHELELLVGARRVHERENVEKRLRQLGLIGGDGAPSQPTFLVATAAGEVGIDIDADHMVSDLVAWERMVQRLGRVNRRGKGDAEVVVFWSEPSVRNAEAPTEQEKRALTAFACKDAIERLPETDGAYDASPGALRELAETAREDNGLRAQIDKATTPEPLRPALNRALVDAWSMTSLREHTGRPEVAPWLRGWVEEMPQTTLVWRKHLPVRIDDRGRPIPPRKREKAEIEEFFEAAPPHESEKLETETHRIVTWLTEQAKWMAADKPQAAKALDEPEDDEAEEADTASDADVPEDEPGEGSEAERPAPEPAVLRRRDIIAMVLSPGGDFVRQYALDELAQDRKGKAKDELQDALVGKIVVLDARLGGLQAGLLAPRNSDIVKTADLFLNRRSDEDEEWSRQAGFRVQRVESLPDEELDGWDLEHAFTLYRDDEGIVRKWLVVEHCKDAARQEDARSISKPQELAPHQERAKREMTRIAESVGLPGEAVRALALGAALHDEGKSAPRWQRAFKAARDAKRYGLSLPLAKTRGPIDQAVLGGYRHELGSLLKLEGNAGQLKELPEAWRDLVLHLIAAHHGGARPIVETRGCDDAPPSQLEQRARAVALRFARLQRRWGPWGLAWWEALLRAADQQASRVNDAEGDAAAPRGGMRARAAAEG